MSEDKVKPGETTKTERDNLLEWQEKLLPTMKGMLIALALFFFIPSLFQLGYLHWSIFEGTKIEVELPDLRPTDTNEIGQESIAAGQLRSTIALESYILERRYHQANVGLMTSVWIRYQGFATGMILSLIGASFILGKMQETSSKIESESSLWRMSLQSSSPGIIMVALGVMLMIMTIVDQDTIQTKDIPVYIDGKNSAFVEENTPAAVPTIPLPTESDQ